MDFRSRPKVSMVCSTWRRVQNDVNHRIGDVRDIAALRIALEEAKPDIVIHMAAQALVRLSYDEPVETYATNVMGTVNLLEAVRTVVEYPGDRRCHERQMLRKYRLIARIPRNRSNGRVRPLQ